MLWLRQALDVLPRLGAWSLCGMLEVLDLRGRWSLVRGNKPVLSVFCVLVSFLLMWPHL